MLQLSEFEHAYAPPILVLLFECPKHIAKQRHLTRDLEGREADDEAMFEKRYSEYVLENDGIVSAYKQRGLLVGVDTGVGLEDAWKRLFCTIRALEHDAFHHVAKSVEL
ncbi:hypothetical protein ACJ73_01561 [Blastomyces percursus]|uniref:Thymidylate kinase-like domain-containing protein n=1 Tax=Blastomyces percursus TaxID=1658174 RepID=A0A1J9REP6_9EURO|nr:hypothetical protein ACJ73_01561 [Blastomyces percursus]